MVEIRQGIRRGRIQEGTILQYLWRHTSGLDGNGRPQRTPKPPRCRQAQELQASSIQGPRLGRRKAQEEGILWHVLSTKRSTKRSTRYVPLWVGAFRKHTRQQVPRYVERVTYGFAMNSSAFGNSIKLLEMIVPAIILT